MSPRLILCIQLAFLCSSAAMCEDYYIYNGKRYSKQAMYAELERSFNVTQHQNALKVLEAVKRNELQKQGLSGDLLERELTARMKSARADILEEAFRDALRQGVITRSGISEPEYRGGSSAARSTSPRNEASSGGTFPVTTIIIVVLALLLVGCLAYMRFAMKPKPRQRMHRRIRERRPVQEDDDE